MEWLALHEPTEAARWCDQLAQENAPLLRRVAVHALIIRTDLQPKKKIDWLLANTKLGRSNISGTELFRALREIYPEVSKKRRASVIEAVLAFRWPSGEPEQIERFTARHHFDWIHWLHESAPNCGLASQSLDKVWEQYPDWEPRKHPDLSWWIENTEQSPPQSPWSVREILARPITDEWVNELKSFQPLEFPGPDREALLLAVTEAAKRDPDWGIKFAEHLGLN